MNELFTKDRLTKLQVALSQINKTLDIDYSVDDTIHYCQILFNALNNLTNALFPEPGNNQYNFVEMIKTQIKGEKYDIFIESTELEDFVNLNPPVMDQEKVSPQPFGVIPDYNCPEFQNAARKHIALQRAYTEYKRFRKEKNKDRLLIKAASSLYIVRCNLMHEGKTTDGPDHSKNARDKIVSRITIQLQKLLLNLLLDNPNEKLVVYGTLAQNGKNHSVISSINGNWEKCKIEGSLSEENGLPYYRWATNGNYISADLFTSQDLMKNWEKIDNFEGKSYKRQLVPVFLNNNLITIAYIYMKSR